MDTVDSQSPSTCGCGALDRPSIPVAVENRPGLAALAYRVGTHARFKQSLLASLAKHPEFAGLTTRYDEDPTIALLDGWAAVLDVLTFYQERIANEGFLRTATERRSILELARAIGYELGPGVAAGTFLAFTLDRPLTVPSQAIAASTPAEILLPPGTRAQSVPGPDELPQTFETVEEIRLRADWNALKPRRGIRRAPAYGDKSLFLAGTDTNLRPGDSLLIIGAERQAESGSERWDVRRLLTVTPDPERKVTRVTWAEGLGSARFGHITLPAAKDVQIYALRLKASVFGHNAQEWPALHDSMKAAYLGILEDDLTAAQKVEWPGFKIYAPLYPLKVKEAASRALAAPSSGDVIVSQPAGPRPLPVLTEDSIDLDNVYPSVVENGWLVLTKPDWTEVYQIASVVEASRAQFLLSGKVSRVKLSRSGKILGELLDKFEDAVRETTVLAQSEALSLGDEPVTADVQGSSVELDAIVTGLEPGRVIAISGHDATTGKLIGETAILDRTEVTGGVTRLVFTAPLQHRYVRNDMLFLNANVARATHGETRSEILGSGDGSRGFQSFTLKHRPLTFVSAATARGIATTLEVRVDGIRWSEVTSLYGQPPDARVFITRRADDGTVTVQFGDGITGARLPSGQDNVVATYRSGIGTEAMVDAGQINLLMSRPLGLKEVVNPAPATGAANPETLEGARGNAPLTVLTLDRIVSLEDFEDFTRAFAGVGKARATLLWNGEQRLAHLTIAGVDGADVPPDSDLLKNLRAAIDLARHTDQEVRIGSYASLSFNLGARIKVHPDHLAEDVFAAIVQALLAKSSFDARAFGQGVTSSEVIAAIQGVAGVEAVFIDQFHFTGTPPSAARRLPAADARWDSTSSYVLPAELLVVNPAGITLTEWIGV